MKRKISIDIITFLVVATTKTENDTGVAIDIATIVKLRMAGLVTKATRSRIGNEGMKHINLVVRKTKAMIHTTGNLPVPKNIGVSETIQHPVEGGDQTTHLQGL